MCDVIRIFVLLCLVETYGNKTSSVTYNVTLRRVGATIVVRKVLKYPQISNLIKVRPVGA
jgi:hypothetical protein